MGKGFRNSFIRVFALLLSLLRMRRASRQSHLLVDISIAAFAAACIAFTWAVLLYPKYLSPLTTLPKPPGGSFLHGHLWRILSEWPGLPMQDWINTIPNDGIIRMGTIFNNERLVLTSPDALREALVTNSYDWEKPKAMRESLGRMIGFGVLVASEHDHKFQRKALGPGFSHRQIRNSYPVFWNEARRLVTTITHEVETATANPSAASKFCEPQKVPWALWLAKVTLDVIGITVISCAFGAVEGSGSDLTKAYHNLFAADRDSRVETALETLENLLPVTLLSHLPLERNKVVTKSAQTIRKIVLSLINDKESRLHEHKIDKNADIVDVLLEQGTFTRDELVDQVMTILAAGHETTTTALCWALFILCERGEVQTRLRTEIRTHFPDLDLVSNDDIAERVDKLQYLNAFCNEVLRVYPPVPLTRRTSRRNTHLLGYHIPKGTDILLVPAAVNMSKDLWGEDALDFKPERWLGPGRANSGGATSNFANMTFLHGPRSCIGQGFAKAELVCILAVVVGSFDFAFAGSEGKPEIQPGFLWKLKGDLELRTTLLKS